MLKRLESLSDPPLSPRQARTRGRILRAAIEAFVSGGYRVTSVDSVARQAGVGKGTVYLYFQSKPELLWAAMALERRRQLERLLPLLRAEKDPVDRLRVWIEEELSSRLQMPLSAAALAGDVELVVALAELDEARVELALGLEPAFVAHLLTEAHAPASAAPLLLALVRSGLPSETQRGALGGPQMARELARALVHGLVAGPGDLRASRWF